MNILDLFQSFQTQEQAVDYLEKVRWRGHPVCPYCLGEKVYRHASGDRATALAMPRMPPRIYRHGGNDLSQNACAARKLVSRYRFMLNAKKSASAYQIGRDIGMRRPTVWNMMHRIRIAMADDPEQNKLLHGIVEADETYVGGKPRKGNKRDDDKPTTSADAAQKRCGDRSDGRVDACSRAREEGDLSQKGLAKFIARFVDLPATLLITDEWPGYNRMGKQ